MGLKIELFSRNFVYAATVRWERGKPYLGGNI
jgi:hypothetical protein